MCKLSGFLVFVYFCGILLISYRHNLYIKCTLLSTKNLNWFTKNMSRGNGFTDFKKARFLFFWWICAIGGCKLLDLHRFIKSLFAEISTNPTKFFTLNKFVTQLQNFALISWWHTVRRVSQRNRLPTERVIYYMQLYVLFCVIFLVKHSQDLSY